VFGVHDAVLDRGADTGEDELFEFGHVCCLANVAPVCDGAFWLTGTGLTLQLGPRAQQGSRFQIQVKVWQETRMQMLSAFFGIVYLHTELLGSAYEYLP
jgi:hypothetical protein